MSKFSFEWFLYDWFKLSRANITFFSLLLTTLGYLVVTNGYLAINLGYLIPITCNFSLLLLTSDYFSLHLVPRFGNNEEEVNVQLSHRWWSLWYKGTRKCAIKQEIKFEDYKTCLEIKKEILRTQHRIRCEIQNLFTENFNKIALGAK